MRWSVAVTKQILLCLGQAPKACVRPKAKFAGSRWASQAPTACGPSAVHGVTRWAADLYTGGPGNRQLGLALRRFASGLLSLSSSFRCSRRRWVISMRQISHVGLLSGRHVGQEGAGCFWSPIPTCDRHGELAAKSSQPHTPQGSRRKATRGWFAREIKHQQQS